MSGSPEPRGHADATEAPAGHRDLSLLRQRHRAGLWVLGIATSLLAVANIRIRPNDPLLWVVAWAWPISTVVAYRLLARARTRAAVSASIVAELSVVIALGAVAAFLTGQLTPTTLATNPGRLLTIVVAFVCAMTLPWGTRAQTALCLVTYAIDVVTSRVVLGDWSGTTGMPGVAMLLSLAASVYVAHQLERHRRHRNRAEAELRHAKTAAETASRAKTDFLANVSHEIRTPMNVIIGMIDMVLDSSDVSSEQRGNLERAHASAINLLEIINGLLDAAKIEAGKMTLEVADMHLRRTVEATVALFAHVAEVKHLALTAVIPASLPATVRGDAGRLRQVLINLLGNAVKFTTVGAVTLEVTATEDSDDACSVHFSVRDTGPGIAPDQLERIFEPFGRADDDVARSTAGTGLGLSICRHLVELMGGRIWVESELGRGAEFHFTARFVVPNRASVAASGPAAIAATAQARAEGSANAAD